MLKLEKSHNIFPLSSNNKEKNKILLSLRLATSWKAMIYIIYKASGFN